MLSEDVDLTEEEFSEIVELASSPAPIDRIWAYLRIDKKRLEKIENMTTRDIVQFYREQLAILRQEIMELRQRALGPDPTITDMLNFVQSVELLNLIEKRLRELEPRLQSVIIRGIEQAAELGAQSFYRDIETMVRLRDLSPDFLERVRMMYSPNLAAVEVTIPLAVGDTQRLAPYYMNRIIEKLREGVLRGESFRELLKRLQPVVTESAGDTLGINTVRAELIARWSIIKGYNEEREARYKQAKIPGLAKVWSATLDRRVCPHCLALHGTIVKLDEEFDGSRTFAEKPMGVYIHLRHPPRHPRCRCSLLPWREEWLGKASITPYTMFEQAKQHAKKLSEELKATKGDQVKDPYVNVDKVKPPKPVYKGKKYIIKNPERKSE